MNFDEHYNYCRAHPMQSYLYMIGVCFCVTALGHCFHLPRAVYIPLAVIAYYGLTGGFRAASGDEREPE